MTKPDFKKTWPDYKSPKGQITEHTIPPRQYLMIDGHGDPNTSPNFQNAIETLYPVAFKTKFISKIQHEKDYVVMPLEGLWWAENYEHFIKRNKDEWSWTAMIAQPDFITQAIIDEAMEAAKGKAPLLDQLRFETINEGKTLQALHIGSFDDEAPLIQKIHDQIKAQGGTLSGKHHEIYLSDPRRTAPEKLRTLIRQPFK